MPSYNKSFNFRNGVQVDDDNFIVNPNGLVGIGTSIPTEFLDVYGTAKITGLVTTTNLAVTGVSTFYSDVKIGSGITFNSSTGIVNATKFVGDATGLRNIYAIAIDGWYINAGNISTTSKVGIGTTLPSSQLDVVGDVKVSGIVTALGFGGYQVLVGTESSATKTFSVKVASKTSNHRYTGSGSANAYFIDGIESPFLTLLPGKIYYFDQSDASNSGHRLRFYLEADRTTPYDTNVDTSPQVPGTSGSYTQIIVTDTTPVVLHYQSLSSAYMGNAVQFNSNIVNTPYQITTLAGISVTTGVVTAYSFSGFGTNIQGINATNITNGTLSNSRLAQNVSISGIISAPSGIITSLTSTNLNNTGIATLGITSISNLTVGSAVTITSAGIFAPTGIITAPTFVGGLVGIASTARDLTSNARVNIADIQSQTSSIGISTVSTRLYAERIGVGTNSPSGDIDIHIRRLGQSRLQVTSDTAEAILAVGRNSTLNRNNGALIFGNTAGIYQYSNSKTLDIVNYDTGSLNHYLHYGISGVGTGNFNWIYGQDANNPLMSLTYQGNLGIGITNPTNKLQVSGNISASSLSLSGNITASGGISATGAGTSVSTNILYVYGGKSQIFNSDGSQIFPPVDNLNITSGISTFYDIQVANQLHVGDYVNDAVNSILISPSGIGIGTDDLSGVEATFYAADNFAVFGSIGIGTTTITNEDTTLYVVGNSEFYGDVTAPIFSGSLTGTATSTTNIPNLTGDITSTGTATAIATGVIVNADINASAGIVDTKLATISTAGKVSNSATTATSANTNSAIVARDASGNFSAGTITATTFSASGVTTSQNGFTSGIGVTDPVKITVSGNILTFTVTGVGSTSLTLY